MRRVVTCVVTVFALAAGTDAASAADPILSGYAGPGGGEQALLGGGLVNPSGGGGGGGGSRSLRAPAVTAASGGSASSSGAATAPVPATPGTGSSKTTGTSKPSSAGNDKVKVPSTSDVRPSRGTQTQEATAPVRYPTRGAESGSVLGDAVVPVGLGLLVLVALGLLTARVGVPAPRSPEPSI